MRWIIMGAAYIVTLTLIIIFMAGTGGDEP